ncbi:hypothetical protein [Modicisalibacter luteus]|uniref:hypothetical protein n=1 Tax=Modicisalibacter luteus TaxID=453962 RepID=UPI0036293A9A
MKARLTWLCLLPVLMLAASVQAQIQTNPAQVDSSEVNAVQGPLVKGELFEYSTGARHIRAIWHATSTTRHHAPLCWSSMNGGG